MAKISFQSEKDFEDLLCEMIIKKNEKICSHLLNDEFLVRQFDLGVYGIADIVTFSGCVTYDENNKIDTLKTVVEATVIELKNVPITRDALFQALRYKTFFKKHIPIVDNVEIVLIGPDIDTTSDLVFSEHLGDIKILTFNMSENGIFFEEVTGYVNRNLSEKTCSDATKLILEGFKNVEAAS